MIILSSVLLGAQLGLRVLRFKGLLNKVWALNGLYRF